MLFLTHPGWNGVYKELTLSLLCSGSFSYTSRLKWCLWRTPSTKPCSVHSVRSVSLKHPSWNGDYGKLLSQPIPSTLCTGCFSYTSWAEMMCTWNYSHNPYTVHSVQDVSLTHPGLNRCVHELLPQTHAQHSLVWMFPLHMHVKMVPTETTPMNPYPVCSL